MRRPYRIILSVSALITAMLFVHDYLYDKPSVPYTLFQTIVEIIIFGGMYIGLFFLLIGGTYYAIADRNATKK